MKSIVSSTLSVAVLLAAASACRADEELKPVLAVSVSNCDNLVNKLAVIGRVGNNPAMSQMLDTQVKAMGAAIGLDASQPLGAFVSLDNEAKTVVCIFLPVANLPGLVEMAKKMNPALSDSINLNDNVYEIEHLFGNDSGYAQQKGKWAFITNSHEALAGVPADPAKMLGDLPKKFDVAARASMKDLSPDARRKLVDGYRMLTDKGSQQMPDESDAQYAARLNMTKLGVQQFTTAVNEAEDLLAGFNIDAGTNQARLDVEITARSGTALADKFALVRPGKTNFAGFWMPDAALSANWTRGMADDEVAQIKTQLAWLRAKIAPALDGGDLSEDQVKLVKQWLDDVIGVFEKTADGRQHDGGLAVLLEPAGAAFVAGGAIVDGAKLENVLKQFAAELKKTDPDVAKLIKLNADKHEGVRFHTVSIPTPKPELVPMVGETLEIVLGIADDKLFLAAGHDAAKALKKMISQSKAAAGKEVPPMRMSVSAAPILQLILAASRENMLVQMIVGQMAKAVEGAGGKAHILITAKTIYRGVRYRVEIEEGLLKLLGSIPIELRGGPPFGVPPPGAVPPGGPPPGATQPGAPPSVVPVTPPSVAPPPGESPSPEPEPTPPSEDGPDG